MLERIRGFRKTNHFKLRQWERSIDDDFLRELLGHIPTAYDPQEKYNLVFSRQFCHRLSRSNPFLFMPKIGKNECLIIALENYALITVYKYNATHQLQLLFQQHRGECFVIV